MKCEKCNNEHDGNFATGRFCSRECANSRVWTVEQNKVRSEKLRGRRVGGALEKYCGNRVPRTTVVCKTCGVEFTVRATSGQNRKYCSQHCASKRPGQGGYRPNSTRKIRSLYKGFWMDSGAERRFAELLDAHNIVWTKNTTQWFPYKDKAGKSRKYFPDFYLPDYDYWVEIKGRMYQNENDTLKLEAVSSNIEIQLHDQLELPHCVEHSSKRIPGILARPV